jgi:hypothetical protein
METFFTLKNGGQFAPAQRGQLQLAQRVQYHRLFYINDNYNENE